jgi:hypothetical protein
MNSIDAVAADIADLVQRRQLSTAAYALMRVASANCRRVLVRLRMERLLSPEELTALDYLAAHLSADEDVSQEPLSV